MIKNILKTKYFKGSFFAALVLLVVAGMMPLKSQALTVSPVIIELQGDPGETLTGQVTVLNDETEKRTFTSSVEEVSAEDETGDPQFSETGSDISTWVSVADSVTLGPGESQVLDYTIAIPQNAVAGGHFGAILFSADNPAGTESVTVSAKVGALVFLTVSGQITESGSIISSGLSNGRATMSHLPASILWRFENTGNDRVVPVGNVIVKNWFGNTKATLDANVDDGSVLPSNVRRFDTSWDPGANLNEPVNFFGAVGRELTDFAFGRYTADTTVIFGDTNQTAQSSFSFFIFPWHLLLSVLVLIIIVFYFVWMARGGRKPAKK